MKASWKESTLLVSMYTHTCKEQDYGAKKLTQTPSKTDKIPGSWQRHLERLCEDPSTIQGAGVPEKTILAQYMLKKKKKKHPLGENECI